MNIPESVVEARKEVVVAELALEAAKLKVLEIAWSEAGGSVAMCALYANMHSTTAIRLLDFYGIKEIKPRATGVRNKQAVKCLMAGKKDEV